MNANEIKQRDRWESNDDYYVIHEEDNGSFIASQIMPDGRGGWYFGANSDHTLWFRSYSAARRYLKEHSFIESRFKKVKGYET